MEYSTDGAIGMIGDRTLRRVGELLDRLAPWALGLAVFALSLTPFPEIDTPLVVAAAGICGLVAGLARRWLWPLFAVALVGWVLLAMWPAGFVASYYAATSLRHRTKLVWFLIVAVAAWLVSIPVGIQLGGSRSLTTASFPNALFYLGIAIGLPLAIGLWVDARRQMLAGLRERAERLEREQLARAEEARARERARIAREMHDVVAHRVSLMVLHAGALELNASDERTAEEAALIRTTGREALANLREVLGVLRSPGSVGETGLAPPPVLVDLEGLLDESRAAGSTISRRDEGTPRPLPVLVEQTAYRVVQEALTNVHKHATGADTEVGLRYLPDRLEVWVSNQPTARPVEPLPASGLGLVGLTERVQLTGGRLTAERTPDGGFVVRAELPAASVEEQA